MSDAVFPTLVGLKWDRERTPTFKTVVQTAWSGRESRAAFWSYPRWKYSLSYEILRADVAYHELQDLMGFYLARQGSYDSFLFEDPNDCSVTAQSLGTGTGSLQTFQLQRTFGSFTEPCRAIKGTPSIYLAGVLQSSGYSISSTGLVTFTTPPGNGVAVTATFNYYWRCRFLEDEMEFSEWSYKLWELRKLEFMTEKL